MDTRSTQRNSGQSSASEPTLAPDSSDRVQATPIPAIPARTVTDEGDDGPTPPESPRVLTLDEEIKREELLL